MFLEMTSKQHRHSLASLHAAAPMAGSTATNTLRTGTATNVNLKYLSLITLTAQNAILGLSMRYSRTRPGDLFFETTAVFMAEVIKLMTCLYLVFRDEGHDVMRWRRTLHETVVVNWMDTLKVCIPSAIYLVQNNLLYVAAGNLDVATYQITYQLKILTTAVFAVIMLNKKLIKIQWFSLVVLIVGVALVQTSDAKESKASIHEQSRVKGFTAAICACVLSGLAGIYFEKILKGSDISVWMRNVQLSLLSIPLGFIVCLLKSYDGISTKGFFHGYDLFVWYLVGLNATGGLLVAVVVKYADNILKGFACSLAIILTCVFSVFFFGFQLSVQFCLGGCLVIGSIFLYGYQPKSTFDKASQKV
eukprot:TCALIF_08266-PA protein Name:"Similar to SLC35A2 UDP-galactose translocator (Homo sapiens)" AED:0.10 eAED:0.10 QI:0/0/0.5/0.5/1/1/2/162/360